jgi:uncharacterized protein (DUF305 family)
VDENGYCRQSVEEIATRPGTQPHGAVEALAALGGADFETRFLELMLPHHEGAIQMANQVWQSSGDPHLRRFADQIRHAQGAQIGPDEPSRHERAGGSG